MFTYNTKGFQTVYLVIYNNDFQTCSDRFIYLCVVIKLEQTLEKCQDYNSLLKKKEELEVVLKLNTFEINNLKYNLAKMTKERDDFEMKLRDLQSQVHELSSIQAQNTALEGHISILNKLLKERVLRLV